MTNGQVPPAPPPPSPIPADARSQVAGPATGLLIAGIIGAVMDLSFLFINLIGASLGSLFERDFADQVVGYYEGAIGAAFCLVGLLVAAFIIITSFKMKQLEQWPLAIAASILAMIPCISPCCIVGLPIGIWCLVVLNKPEVKAAFR